MKKIITIAIAFALCFAASVAKDNHAGGSHAAVFLGGATHLETEHTYFAAGADYEYRLPLLHGIFGVGAYGEAVFAEHNEYIFGVPFFVHPVGGLKIFVAPSIAIPEDHPSDADFLFRGGVGYDIHVKNYSVSPVVNVDYIHEEIILVYGVAFGMSF